MQNSTCNTLVQDADSSQWTIRTYQAKSGPKRQTRQHARNTANMPRPHRSIMHLHGLVDPLTLPRLLMLDHDHRYHSSITAVVAGLPEPALCRRPVSGSLMTVLSCLRCGLPSLHWLHLTSPPLAPRSPKQR